MYMSISTQFMNRQLLTFYLLFAVFITRALTSEDCGQTEFIKCSQSLNFLSSTYDFATKKEELNELCPELHAGMKCIRSYTRRCMSLEQRKHFIKLYEGTGIVIRELCQEGKYQTEYLKHAPCMKKVGPDYEVCAKVYQTKMTHLTSGVGNVVHNTTRDGSGGGGGSGGGYDDNTSLRDDIENKMINSICCSFKEYLDCSEKTALMTCGTETARFTRGLLDKMASSLIVTYCEELLESGVCGGANNLSISFKIQLLMIFSSFLSFFLFKF